MLTHVSPYVYILPFVIDRDRPNLGYVHCDYFSVLIDAGNSKSHLETMLDAVDSGSSGTKLALITHWHWDHTFGMHAFSGTMITHTTTNGILKELTAWEWTEAAMAERLKSGAECEFCHTHMK